MVTLFNKIGSYSAGVFCGGLAVLLFASSTPLSGQTQEIQGQFRLLALTPIRADLYYAVGDALEACRPRLNRFSESYAFRFPADSDRMLRFYQKLPAAAAADSEAPAAAANYRPLGAVNVPASGDYLLFLRPQFVANGNSRSLEKMGFSLVEDDFAREGSAGWLFLNTTDQNIVGRIGQDGKPIRIEANEKRMLTVETEKQFDLVQFAARVDGEAQIFYSTAWPIYQNSRYMVIFGTRSQTDEIGVYRIAGGSP